MPIHKIFFAVVGCTLWTASAAAAGTNCHDKAIRDLKRLAPDGYAIYVAIEPKSSFLDWVTCDDVQLGLTTAVHETVHLLTAEHDSYVLISGDQITRIEETPKLFEPQSIAGQFDNNSTFVETYLKPGAASSATYLRYLLDELNAYSHDLNAAVKLLSISPPDRMAYHRDGLAALMAFVAAYMETARAHHPNSWAVLQKPAAKTTIIKLWAQAEAVMSQSCKSPDIGFEAPQFLAKVCAQTAKHGIGQLLGRAPVCPKACLSEPRIAGAED
jgi:hypothetical protein